MNGIDFNKLMGILKFKPPIDIIGGIDIIALDEEFSKQDKDYDHENCTYKGVPTSMSEYVKLKYGHNAAELIIKLI